MVLLQQLELLAQQAQLLLVPTTLYKGKNRAHNALRAIAVWQLQPSQWPVLKAHTRLLAHKLVRPARDLVQLRIQPKPAQLAVQPSSFSRVKSLVFLAKLVKAAQQALVFQLLPLALLSQSLNSEQEHALLRLRWLFNNISTGGIPVQRIPLLQRVQILHRPVCIAPKEKSATSRLPLKLPVLHRPRAVLALTRARPLILDTKAPELPILIVQLALRLKSMIRDHQIASNAQLWNPVISIPRPQLLVPLDSILLRVKWSAVVYLTGFKPMLQLALLLHAPLRNILTQRQALARR